MARTPMPACPQCQHKFLRRIYLQNGASTGRPTKEVIQTWLYCENCEGMTKIHNNN